MEVTGGQENRWHNNNSSRVQSDILHSVYALVVPYKIENFQRTRRINSSDCAIYTKMGFPFFDISTPFDYSTNCEDRANEHKYMYWRLRGWQTCMLCLLTVHFSSPVYTRTDTEQPWHRRVAFFYRLRESNSDERRPHVQPSAIPFPYDKNATGRTISMWRSSNLRSAGSARRSQSRMLLWRCLHVDAGQRP